MAAHITAVYEIQAPTPPNDGEWYVVVVAQSNTGAVTHEVIAITASKYAAQTVGDALRAQVGPHPLEPATGTAEPPVMPVAHQGGRGSGSPAATLPPCPNHPRSPTVPSRPPRVCSGCGAVVSGRCGTCSRPAWGNKPSSWSGGSTRRWRAFRASWLAVHPLCVGYPAGYTCGRVADVVDHIEPLSRFEHGPARERARLDPDNVQSLCNPCHTRKTADESREAQAVRRAQDATGQLW